MALVTSRQLTASANTSSMSPYPPRSATTSSLTRYSFDLPDVVRRACAAHFPQAVLDERVEGGSLVAEHPPELVGGHLSVVDQTAEACGT